MANILIVDDEGSIRNTFRLFLSKNKEYNIFVAKNATLAMEIIECNALDLIITDIVMPKISGIEFLEMVRKINKDIPIVIMTGEPTVETAKEAVVSDANDYLIKPVSKEVLLKTVNYALAKKQLLDAKKQLESENKKYRENLEKLVQQRTKELQKAVNGTVMTIAKILELKDPYTAGHERKVGDLALAMAKKMHLTEEKQKCIYFAGFLHDIGKLLIASEILSKPGKLSKGEFAVIKEHVENGRELTVDIELPWPISDIIMQHHERENGSGYPKGLKGDEIKLEAKILAIADVIEAMTSHRPYRPKFSIDIALEEIKKNRGILYNEEAANAAVQLFEEDNYDFDEVGLMEMKI